MLISIFYIMLKNISNLKGATILNKTEQQSISGGGNYCAGGCVGKSEGDSCYTSSGNCPSLIVGTCTYFGGNNPGQLGCNPN